jgi:hypothetical protein
MSIAGNNVPPVPDDSESMGGTNSTMNIFMKRSSRSAILFDRLLIPCYKLRPYAADRPLTLALSHEGARELKTRRLRRADVELARSLKVVPITMSDIGKHKLNGLIRFKERLQN